MKNATDAARGPALARPVHQRTPSDRGVILAARRRRAQRRQPEAPPTPRAAASDEGLASLPRAPAPAPAARRPRRRVGRAWGYRVASGRRAGGRIFGAGRWV